MLKNSSTHYGRLAKILHWLIFLLVFVMLIFGYFMDGIQDKTVKSQIFNLHKLTGITILFLMLLRMVWALTNPKPALPLGTPNWQRHLERAVHVMIYAALIAMPISGWVMSIAGGHPPHFFKFQLELPIQQDKAFSKEMFETHSWIAIIIITLVSVHILAALYHHFIKKDDVLRRMM